jgi:hypothetical protein
VPAIAFAYSDQATYDDLAINGGAGGRYFTGSRVDGNGCSVCHVGPESNDFSIDLPASGALEAGKRYDVTVRWTSPEKPHSVHFEISNPNGSHAMVEVPTVLPKESMCGTMPAVYVIDRGNRRIVGVEPCGASKVTASFVATGGPIEVSVAGVAGDNSDSATGDATFERRITLGVARAGPDGGCEVGSGNWLGVLLVFGFTVRSRRAR